MAKRFFYPAIIAICSLLMALFLLTPLKSIFATTTPQKTDRTFSYTNELNNKTIVYYGDSITARLGLMDNEKDYMQILQDEFGFYYSNQAVSGATWSVAENSTNNIFSQMEKSQALYKNADYISIFLGTNDFGIGRKIGTPYDKDTNTVCGAINLVLSSIIDNNPNVKIMLITELNRYDFNDNNTNDDSLTNSAGKTINEHRNALKTMAEIFGCSLVDLSNVVTDDNYQLLLNADNLHVREAGYYAIANAIKNYNNPTTEIDRTFSYTNELNNKTIVYYGDSITARLGLMDNEKDYMQILQDEFGFYYSNQAVSGATWSVSENSTNNIFSQMEKSQALYKNADYISIFLGTNDFGANRSIGTSFNTDQTTVYGAMKKVLDTIIDANPDVKIALLTPINRYDLQNDLNGNGNSLTDFRSAISTIATMYNCTLIDLSNVVTTDNFESLLNADKLHVSELGYQSIANAIKNQ